MNPFASLQLKTLSCGTRNITNRKRQKKKEHIDCSVNKPMTKNNEENNKLINKRMSLDLRNTENGKSKKTRPVPC